MGLMKYYISKVCIVWNLTMKLVNAVKPSERLNFLSQQLDDDFGYITSMFEMSVYYYMDKLCIDYSSGVWEYYKIDNAFFIAPIGDKSYRMVLPSSSNKKDNIAVCNITAGVIVCLFALSHLSNMIKHEKLLDCFDGLVSFAETLESKENISAIVDIE